jgi:hypothetical protein
LSGQETDGVDAAAGLGYDHETIKKGTDVFVISSLTLLQAEFEMVARVSVSKAEIERSQKSNRVAQIYANKLVGEST